jgi:hypothetical protein
MAILSPQANKSVTTTCFNSSHDQLDVDQPDSVLTDRLDIGRLGEFVCDCDPICIRQRILLMIVGMRCSFSVPAYTRPPVNTERR